MTREELKSALREQLDDSLLHREQSNWTMERQALMTALDIALHLASPEDYPTPFHMRVCDWAAFRFAADGKIETTIIENCTRAEAAEIIAKGSENWMGLLPASTLNEES